jgi:DNA-binding MarR family transcriptional regulator
VQGHRIVNDFSDPELVILESIKDNSENVRQRDLARNSGLSLGMTNAIVKRLATKGWLTVRKVSNRNIRYIVSPKGIEQLTRRGYRYLKRTMMDVVRYREAIERHVEAVQRRNATMLVLVGRSDLDFIVELACARCGVRLLRAEPGEDTPKPKEPTEVVWTLYAEKYFPERNTGVKHYLSSFLIDVINNR